MILPINRIQQQLIFIYGNEVGEQTFIKVKKILAGFLLRYPKIKNEEIEHFTEKDSILITYGDQFSGENELPLESLLRFSKAYLSDSINGIHLLPFYPYSSDDGFSVIDYWEVDQNIGTWENIKNLSDSFLLMFDAVVNHISKESSWFQGYLNGEAKYQNYFISVEGNPDASKVVRPRSFPLFHKFNTSDGDKNVWTTFGDDQIDLNYENPNVLLEIISLLLFYIEKGAKLVRLDAIGFLWKKIETTSIHLPQTHAIVKLFRAVIDFVAPHIIIITETNVPNEENISYFGEPVEGTNQFDEAHMVYQFSLGPLVLHTMNTGSIRKLHKWLESIQTLSKDTTFLNFIASHDGIGLMPAKNILSEGEINNLVEKTVAHGGKVSYKTNPDGSKSVYELNITLFDVLNNPAVDDIDLQIERFIASQVIMISLAGVPGIYIHSLFGSHNCKECEKETERARSINRRKFQLSEIEKLILDPHSSQSKVFSKYLYLLKIRKNILAFHPNAEQEILQLNDSLFSIARYSKVTGDYLLVLVNVSDKNNTFKIDFDELRIGRNKFWKDLIGGQCFNVGSESFKFSLLPYQCMWLTPLNESC